MRYCWGILLLVLSVLPALGSDDSDAPLGAPTSPPHSAGFYNRLLKRSERKLQLLYEEWSLDLKDERKALLAVKQQAKAVLARLQEQKPRLTAQKSEYEGKIRQLEQTIEQSDDPDTRSRCCAYLSDYKAKLENINNAIASIHAQQADAQLAMDGVESEFEEWRKEVALLDKKIERLIKYLDKL